MVKVVFLHYYIHFRLNKAIARIQGSYILKREKRF